MKRNELVRIAIASVIAAGSLSGCSTYHSIVNYIQADNASVCPDAAILASTSSLPAFDPTKGIDPSNLIYSVAMTNVKTRCDFDKKTNRADANLEVFFQATRPPGGDEASYRVPYFVAVTTSGEIKDKQMHWLELGFDRGATTAVAQDDVESIEIKAEKTTRIYEYHLVVGFQLTKSQIDYNAKMGQYEP